MKEGKSFQISQKEVLNAYKAVKANKGTGGVDGVDIEEFEKNWKNRLYTLWNRLSSRTYFPKPEKGVEIPKKNGKKRLLGIPTIEEKNSENGITSSIFAKSLPRINKQKNHTKTKIGVWRLKQIIGWIPRME